MAMKTDSSRFEKAMQMFPKASAILETLDANNIVYGVGGSVALYTQGVERLPHDVDIMLMGDAHDTANKLFGIKTEIVERPNVSMHKSSPVTDGTVDFLSNYIVISEGKSYTNPPEHTRKVCVSFQNKKVPLIPAEKIAVFKLIGQREHHNDSNDVKELLQHPDFNFKLFWTMANILNAREIVAKRLPD